MAAGLAPAGRMAALLVLLTLLWGLNWPIMKVAMADVPPLTFRALCTLFGGLGLLGFAWATGGRMIPRRREVGALGILALFNVLLWQVLSAYGVSLIPSGRAAILAYSMPAWSVALGALFLGEALTARRLVALALGLGGMALLIGDDLAAVGRAPTGAVLMMGAALTWAIGTVLTKRARWSIAFSAMIGWQLVAGGLPITVAALVVDAPHWTAPGTPALLATLYSVVLASLLGHWLWFRVLDHYPAGIAAISTMAIPVIGLSAGALLLDENLGITEMIAAVLVVGALAAIHGPGLRAAFSRRLPAA